MKRTPFNPPFGAEDLKELRKAIKGGDKKRIAELTAKIGKRSTFQERDRT